MSNRFKNRPLSFSQLNSFHYNPDEWYDNYILGIRMPPTPEMLAGNEIGDKVGTEDCPISLNPPGVKEYPMKAQWNDITLIGYADHYCPDTLTLHENKTSYTKGRWTQGKVDKHDQLTMYALLLQLQDGVEPEDITMYLNFIETRMVGVKYDVHQPPRWKQFETKRTKQDVTNYQQHILDTIEMMDEYIRLRKQRDLSTPRPPAFKAV